MILYGASGHGKVIAETLRENGISDIVFWDDNEDAIIFSERVCLPVKNCIDNDLIITVGLNHVRYDIVGRYQNANFGIAIHRTAVVSKSCRIGFGSVVLAMAVINSSSKIGKHTIVNSGAIVEHDCVIGDFVHISPSATVCGGVRIGEGTWIGAGAKIKNGVTIGKWSIIAMGAVVISDIPDFVVYSGVPAKYKEKNFNVR